MAHISVTRSHTLGREAARRAAEDVAAELQQRLGLRSVWEGDTLRVQGKGFTGALTATDDAVHVEAKLGLALRPLRRALEAEIEQRLNRVVGAHRVT